MDKLVCVKVFELRMEAEMAQGFLDANGIKAHVYTDDAGGTMPILTGGARLMVQQADFVEAEKLLEALESGATIEKDDDNEVDDEEEK